MTDTTVARVQRVLPATPEEVFDQWLDPESLADWMCPRPDRCVAITVEPHVGGLVRFDVDHAGTSVLITGTFLVIERPRQLRFTWSNSNWPDPTAVSVVNVDFAPSAESQTLMSIEHTLLPPHEFDNFQNGWARTSDQLAAVLQRR